MNKILLMIINELVIWIVFEIIIFTIIITIAIRYGLFRSILNKDGTYKKRLNIEGKLISIIMMFGIIIFPVSFDLFVLKLKFINLSFYTLLFLNSILLLVIFLWDIFVIDSFVLLVWRPKFLRISEELISKSMKKHIITSLFVQLIPMVVIALLITIIFYFILLP